MEEIKLEEYVRTKEGYIGKLIKIIDDYYLNRLVIDTKIKVRHDGLPETSLYLREEDIVNHSKNIIDLIEVGDLVVYKIKGFEHYNIDIVKEYTKVSTLKTELRVGLYSLEQVEILKILTKEKFENESYKV